MEGQAAGSVFKLEQVLVTGHTGTRAIHKGQKSQKADINISFNMLTTLKISFQMD